MNGTQKQMLEELVTIRGAIVAVLRDVNTGLEEYHVALPKGPDPVLDARIKRSFGKNRVTTAGAQWYAEKACGQTPAQFTAPAMELGTAGDAPAAGSTRANVTTKVATSLKVIDSTYPKTSDPDSENTGDGALVASWRVSYLTTEANATNIDRVVVTNFASGSPGASEPVLMYGVFGSPFTKTSSQTLKVFVNHTLAGV